MENNKDLSWIFLTVLIFMIGLAAGMTFDAYLINNSGIPVTSYCKEIQIDTIQYDYKQNLYKYKIEIIK